MGEEIKIPRELMEEVAGMRFPQKTDARLQFLMDGNNDGRLTPTEHEELEALVEVSESMSLMRAKALRAWAKAMMLSWNVMVDAVKNRAGHRCEYCRMHQSLQGATFHLEHIHPRSAGGATELDNLALACPSCNFHKSDRVQAIDPTSGEAVKLFHARLDQWADHFSWQEYRVVGLTAIGRATIEALDMNHERHRLIRQAEEHFDLFPP